MDWLAELRQRLQMAPAVLVSVSHTQGSVPREAGSWMAVFADRLTGTIGGGHLEFEAVTLSRQALKGRQPLPQGVQRVPLGPGLGQCCGGVVHLTYELIDVSQVETLLLRLRPLLKPLALFGGGHVGRALVQVLGELPFAVRWIDSRDEVFPDELPAYVVCEHSEPVQLAVHDLEAASSVLIMSFSHAEDLEILAACLLRQREKNDLAYIGLIGSATKWARFKHRLQDRGFVQADFDRVTCPIGLPGISSKLPQVIAVSVAAQLLQLTG